MIPNEKSFLSITTKYEDRSREEILFILLTLLSFVNINRLDDLQLLQNMTQHVI